MNKKQYLELLIKSFGLTPRGVKHYRTDGREGEYSIGVGWEGCGVNDDNETVIDFNEPDGFNFAVYEILRQAKRSDLEPKYNKAKIIKSIIK